MNSKLGTLAGIALYAATLATPAIASTTDAANYLAEAKKSAEKGDGKSAAIQLKNAVQADPENGATRFELGRLEMQLGDYLSAEKELRAAIDHNFDRAKVDPILAETLLHLNRSEDLLAQIPAGDRPPELEAQVRVARGYALLDAKKTSEAKASFQQAMSLASKPGLAKLGLAHALALEGDMPAAMETTKAVVEADPNFADAWTFYGQLHRKSDDMAAARSDFDKALAIAPGSAVARVDRAALLIATNELPLAQSDVGVILKSDPQNPMAIYLQAMIQAKNKDYHAAVTSLQNLKGNLNTFPPALYLLAAINLEQNELGQAEDNINRYLAQAPNDESGTALLASLLLKRGNNQRAIEVLKAASEAKPQSLKLLGMLGNAYVVNKQPDAAADIYDRMSKMAPADVNLRTGLAAQKLRIGRTDEAITDLQAATELAPTSAATGMLLVLTYLREDKLDDALKAAQDMRDRIPTDPVAENLLGAILLRKGDNAQARAHFQKSVDLKADFLPARINLGQLDAAEGKYDEARKTLDEVLQQSPTNVTALISEANLSFAEGKREDAVLLLEKARNGNPDLAEPRIRLVAAYLDLKDPAKAAEIAKELEKIAPNDTASVNAVGEAKLAGSDTAGAIAAFNHLAELVPDSGVAQLQRARAFYAAKNNDEARKALDRASELAPTDRAIEQQLVRFSIETEAVDSEAARLRGLAAAKPNDPAFDTLEGDLLLANNKRPEAEAAFRRGLAKRSDSAELIIRIAFAQEPDHQDKSASILKEWLQKHPDTPTVRSALAGFLIGMKSYDQATAEYETLIKTTPDDANALNNIAWLYQRKKDGRALDYAEKAYKLRPDSPDISDTLAWILVQNGQNERGLEILQKLQDKDTSPDLRYHLAVALKNAGRREEARQALKDALSGDKAFDSQDDARALMSELGS